MKEYQKIKPFSMEFQTGLNAIVGENGSGKSTLLDLLQEKNSVSKITAKKGTQTRFLDTERANPRTKALDPDDPMLFRFSIGSRFMSHGEVMLPMIQACEDFKDLVLIIDEPEAGLSLKNQKGVLESLLKAVNNGCQVIIATHSYIIISNIPEVFSMDEKKWIKSSDYLNGGKNGRST